MDQKKPRYLILFRYYQDSVIKSLISLYLVSYLFRFSSFRNPMCLLSHSSGKERSLYFTPLLPQTVSFSYTYCMCSFLHPSLGHGPGLLYSNGSWNDLNATGGLVDSWYLSYPHFKYYHILQWTFIVCFVATFSFY